MSLRGQVAIITGASSGIGEAVARNLDEGGMNLVLTARRDERLRALASSLREAEYLSGDIIDSQMPSSLLDLALSKFGRCDVVVNNAGILTVGAIEEIDLERVAHMVRVNVEATYRLAYTAVRHFKSEHSGHLVNISSILGTKTRPTAGAYAGTKYAIEALSESLRLELAGTGVGVTCIEPGLVLTELHNHMPVHPKDSMGISSPLMPEDIARAIRFVLEQPAHVRISNMMVLPEQSPL